MKKLLFLLLFVSNLAFAQKTEYAYKAQSGTYDKSEQKWIWDELQESEMSIKLDGAKVYLENKSNTVLTTYEKITTKSGVDDDGDSYKLHTWYAYDDKNRKCKFSMLYYDNIPLVVYSVFYNDVAFRFYIRNNKLSNF
jgi:hypothetical protein